MAQKSVTINLPDSSSYTKASKIGLGLKDISTPQAQGGRERVTVGATLRADQTSMGQLSGALTEFNRALSIYGGIQEKNEQRGLKEIRNASNEQRREMIGQEADYFRSLGIRYHNIPEVKRGLGTVESGKMQADWEEHLSNTVLPSQEGVNGANALNSEQISNEFNRWREEWIGNSEILNRSQLAKDGFRADTDDFFDRAAPQWVSRADTYYEQNVEIPTAVARMMGVSKSTPTAIVDTYKDITVGMPPSRQRVVIGQIVKTAQGLDTETGYNEALNLLSNISSSDIMMGNQKLSDTMVMKFGTEALKEKQRKFIDDAEADKVTALQQKHTIELAEANEVEAAFRKELAGAETPAEERIVTEKYRQLGVQSEGMSGGFILEAISQIESARATSASQQLTRQKQQDEEFGEDMLNGVHQLINSQEATTKIRADVTQRLTDLDTALENGTISTGAHSELSITLNSFKSQTGIDTVRLDFRDSLVRSQRPESSLLNQRRSDALVRGVLKANEMVGLPPKAFNTAFQDTAANMTLSPQFESRHVNLQVRDIYTDAYADIEEKREQLASEAIVRFPTVDGKHNPQMEDYISTNLSIYEKERYDQTVTDLVSLHEEVKERERIAGMIASGRDPNDPMAVTDEAWTKIKAWDATEDIEDVWKFERLPDGSVSVDDNLEGWGKTIDLSKPITKYNSNVNDFLRASQKLVNSEVFPLLNLDTRQNHSKRMGEAMRLEATTSAFSLLNDREIVGQVGVFPKSGLSELEALKNNITKGRPNLDDALFNGLLSGPALTQYDRKYNYDEAQEDMQSLASYYSVGGMFRQDYMDDAGKIDPFFLGGVNNPELGFGYRFRKQLPFVQYSFIKSLNEGLKTAQGRTKRERLGNLIGEATEKSQSQIKEMLQMYTAGGEDPQDALVNLFDYHKSIYLKQGRLFDDEQTLPMQ